MPPQGDVVAAMVGLGQTSKMTPEDQYRNQVCKVSAWSRERGKATRGREREEEGLVVGTPHPPWSIFSG